MTPLFAYIPILFPDSIESKIGITEIVSAGGFMIGPIIGSFFYKLGGYTLPFIFFGSLALLLIPMINN